MKKRSFTELERTKTQEELESMAKKIAIEYSKSEAQFARTYFSEQYNISKDCFYKMLEYATVRNLISEEDVNNIALKASGNQRCHANGNFPVTSYLHWNEIKKKRNKYIAGSLSAETVKSIAEDYENASDDMSKEEIAQIQGISTMVLDEVLVRAKVLAFSDERIRDFVGKFACCPQISKRQFSVMYKIPMRVIDELLKKAIVENMVDDKTVELIYARSLQNANKSEEENVKKFFRKLKKERKKK